MIIKWLGAFLMFSGVALGGSLIGVWMNEISPKECALIYMGANVVIALIDTGLCLASIGG